MSVDVKKLQVNELNEELQRLDTKGLKGDQEQEDDNEQDFHSFQEPVEEYSDEDAEGDGGGDGDNPQEDDEGRDSGGYYEEEEAEGEPYESQPASDSGHSMPDFTADVDIHKPDPVSEPEAKPVQEPEQPVEVKPEVIVEVKMEGDQEDTQQDNHRTEQQCEPEASTQTEQVKAEADRAGHYGHKRPYEENRGYGCYEHREDERVLNGEMVRRSPRGKIPRRFISDIDDGDISSEQRMSSAGTEKGDSRGHGGAGNAARSRSTHCLTGAWKTEADPDITPQRPRFMPKRPPGIQTPLNIGRPSPGEIFSHFFDAEVLQLLCTNTNKNAERNKQKGKKFIWKAIEMEEMTQYIGMLLFMTVVKLQRKKDFWRRKNIFQVPFPATVMTRDRFMAISDNLHMSDPKEDAVNDAKKGTADYDPLHRLGPMLEMMRIRCMAVYHPMQNISVDERMVATKARLSIKQYMKAKPTKWGLKFFVLADSNGYTIDFRLYTGKSKFASGKGLPYDVVTTLVNKSFLGSGYIIYCDNFYTSPHLFRQLIQQGYGAVGTYRQGRIGTPSTQENAIDKLSPRGTIRWIRDDDLLYVKWMDTREVSICTSVHSVYSGETVLRWQKRIDGKFQRVSVPRPTAIGEYNRYMGGVDTSDQMLGTNSAHRKTMRWPITVFQHFVDIAVTNSFIIHKERASQLQEKPLSRQAFQEKLCAQLLRVTVVYKPKKKPIHDHFPVPTANLDNFEKQSKATVGRRKCTLCKRSTPWQCEECDVGLCLQLDRNCFRTFHKDIQG